VERADRGLHGDVGLGAVAKLLAAVRIGHHDAQCPLRCLIALARFTCQCVADRALSEAQRLKPRRQASGGSAGSDRKTDSTCQFTPVSRDTTLPHEYIRPVLRIALLLGEVQGAVGPMLGCPQIAGVLAEPAGVLSESRAEPQGFCAHRTPRRDQQGLQLSNVLAYDMQQRSRPDRVVGASVSDQQLVHRRHELRSDTGGCRPRDVETRRIR
jgi:hypothetical protein